jgi:putative peptide zinc metalloprotease protein
VLGYVAQLADPTIRTVVAQHQITSVRGRLQSIEVRLAESPGEILTAQIDHIVPTATNRLPSMALGAGGGGAISVDARDPDGVSTSEPFFMVDLALPSEAPISGFGGRVHVRFDYQSEPIFWRAKRGIRRLFMGELGV